MILGVGADLADVQRIVALLTRFGPRFIERVFTETERVASERRRNPAASYAKRFAAKEACAKALGTGVADGVFWRDMGVVDLGAGRPGLTLTGGARAHLARLTPRGCASAVHLSLTDEGPYAQAFVVIEARPQDHLPPGMRADTGSAPDPMDPTS